MIDLFGFLTEFAYWVEFNENLTKFAYWVKLNETYCSDFVQFGPVSKFCPTFVKY